MSRLQSGRARDAHQASLGRGSDARTEELSRTGSETGSGSPLDLVPTFQPTAGFSPPSDFEEQTRRMKLMQASLLGETGKITEATEDDRGDGGDSDEGIQFDGGAITYEEEPDEQALAQAEDMAAAQQLSAAQAMDGQRRQTAAVANEQQQTAERVATQKKVEQMQMVWRFVNGLDVVMGFEDGVQLIWAFLGLNLQLLNKYSLNLSFIPPTQFPYEDAVIFCLDCLVCMSCLVVIMVVIALVLGAQMVMS